MDDKRKVIVDTDFLRYLLRNRTDKDKYFLMLVEDLKIQPAVHEFLFHKEMIGSEIITRLGKEGKISVINYRDFLKNQEDEMYYKTLFQDMYKYVNEREWRGTDFKVYQESGANLGEIHSIILALFTGYSLFLSNDNGSKRLVEHKINTQQFHLKVENILDIFEEIAVMEHKSFKKADFVNLTKGDSGRKQGIKKIKDIWKEKGQ